MATASRPFFKTNGIAVLPAARSLRAAPAVLVRPRLRQDQHDGHQRQHDPRDVTTAIEIAIIWAGFKMIFHGARLSDVANVLIGGTLIGGATAFSTYIVG